MLAILLSYFFIILKIIVCAIIFYISILTIKILRWIIKERNISWK